MNNIIFLGLALLTIILNGLIGHYFAPDGIMMTPVVLIITTYVVCIKIKNINLFFVCILTFVFVAINDILIKLYSGGRHDNEGLGWIHLMLFVGLLPTFGILLTTVFKRRDEKLIDKLLCIILFIGLIVGHLQLFGDLGLGRNYRIIGMTETGPQPLTWGLAILGLDIVSFSILFPSAFVRAGHYLLNFRS